MPAQNGSQLKESTGAQADGGKQALLRELKGAPLSVLLALEIYGAQGRVELVERTGWSYSAVRDGVTVLEEMDLVRRLDYRNWSLAEGINFLAIFRLPQAAEVVSKDSSGREVFCENSSRRNEVSTNGNGLGAEVVSENSSANDGNPEVFGENSSGSEVVTKSTSTPHDHDGVIKTKGHSNQNKHHPSKTTMTTLARALKALDPPFQNARLWLQEASPRLVQGWLDYLQNLDRESRRRIRNEAAFLRWKVESEEEPPPAPEHHAQCKWCNKAIRDAEGRCLVCLGLVAV